MHISTSNIKRLLVRSLALFAFLIVGAASLFGQIVTFNGSATDASAGQTRIPRGTGTGDCATFPQDQVGDNNKGTHFACGVSGLGQDYELFSARINLTHTFDGDLGIYLVAPNGEKICLSADLGGGGDNFTNTIFFDQSNNISTGTPPFTGAFRPLGGFTQTCGFPSNILTLRSLLGQFSNGQNGTWTLVFIDDAGGDIGDMIDWTLTFKNRCQFVDGTFDAIEAEACSFAPSFQVSPSTQNCSGGGQQLLTSTFDGQPFVSVLSGGFPFGFYLLPNNIQAGPHEIVWTMANGGVMETQIVNASEDIDPVPLCQNVTLNMTGPAIALDANLVNNNSFDNCGAVTLGVSPATFNCMNLGANTVTLTVRDKSNNSATCMATVTVVDSKPPTAKCRNLTIPLNGVGQAAITAAQINNGSTDNCTFSLSASPLSFNCGNLGANNVTLSVQDVQGNISTCNSVITIVDNLNPTAICQNLSFNLPGNSTVNVAPSQLNNGSTDNCGITFSASKTTFGCANAGANSVILTVTDGSGNKNTCTSIVTITETTPPTALCKNASVTMTGPIYTLAPALVDNGSSDNCTFTLSVSPSSFNCSNVGTNAVTLTVTDGSGNVATCPATLTLSGADTDGDGFINPCDNCPNISNGDQADTDGDNVGDVCETCLTSQPLNLTATSISSSAAQLNWDVVAGATSYNLKWKTAAAAAFSTVSNIANPTFPLMNLQPGTAYQFKVEANCAGGTSGFSALFPFTTTGSPSGCSENNETNNTSATSKAVTPGAAKLSRISTVADVDWWKFTNTVGTPYIKVQLQALPKNYDMVLYRGAAVLGSSSNNGVQDEEIIYNNTATSTINYVKIFGVDGAFSNTACYSLLVTLSATPLFQGGGSGENGGSFLEEKGQLERVDFALFPNPASDELTVELPFRNGGEARVSVLDFSGKRVAEQSREVGENFRFDVGSLPSGVYFVQVRRDGSTSIQKMVIAR